MRIGILGGTGPAGRGLAVRLAAAGMEPVIGSRDSDRAASVAGELIASWPDHELSITGRSNEETAACEVVVVATAWDAAAATARTLAPALEGKVVVSMANAMMKQGRSFVALAPSRGSVAASLQSVLPGARIAAAFHHLPAAEMEELASPLRADVLVCSDHPEATSATIGLVERIDGLRGVDAGDLAQAGPIEAFTAVLVTVNIRHKAHTSLQLSGLGDR